MTHCPYLVQIPSPPGFNNRGACERLVNVLSDKPFQDIDFIRDQEMIEGYTDLEFGKHYIHGY